MTKVARSPRGLVLLAAALSIVLHGVPARAATVGCYEMCTGQGEPWHEPPVKLAGHLPVLLTDLTATDLAGIDVLFVTNCSNDVFGEEYLSRLADIEAAVRNGMVLVLHDRLVDTAETILPGGGGIEMVRDFGDDANVNVLDATTLVTDGPGGLVDDSTLDGGTSSSHGYASVGTLPAGARAILSRGNPAEVVTFSYDVRPGRVIYSTVPLDYYLDGDGGEVAFTGPDSFRLTYAPNVVAYAAAPRCGDGRLDEGEECDDGNASSGDCCAPTCRFEAAGTQCRPAAGICDAAETCTGTSATCPADALRASGTICRGATDACDAAETCTGASAVCPPDGLAPAGTVCRAATDACDVAEACTGTSTACPGDALAPAGTVCRSAPHACDLAEVCGGLNAACPADVTRLEGDLCDDGDPATATSSCEAQQCLGVAVGIVVPPVLQVPATQNPAKVKIPVEIQIPDTPGSQAARVTMQGFVDCLDVPPSDRPAQCGTSAIQTQDYLARVGSVFLAVTRPRTKILGRTQSRVVRTKLPLTKLGQKLFARLKGGEQQRQLPVQVTAQLRDRQGRTISAIFQSLLERRR